MNTILKIRKEEIQEILSDVFDKGKKSEQKRKNIVKDGDYISLCTNQILEVFESTKIEES